MIYSQRASLVHPGEEMRKLGKGKSAVGQLLNRMRQCSYTDWKKAPGTATAKECQKRGSENVGAIGNRVVAGNGSEAGRFRHPQRRTGRESVAGDEVKENVRVAVGKSDDKRIGGQLLPSGRNGGRAKNYSQRFTQRIGRRVKPQSGGRFGQGAATAGDVRLGNFRKRPDQQREGSKIKNQISRKGQYQHSTGSEQTNTIRNENGHGNSKSKHSTSNKNKQIRSRVPSL